MATPEFVYCPKCATRLERQHRYGRELPACPACDFVHFLDPKVAVIAFVTHADRLLLIRRAVDPAKGKWALPGGYMDAGEMPETALRRELLEEVGLAIEIEGLIDIFPMAGRGDKSPGIVLAYAASPGSGTAVANLQSNDDVSAAGWFAAEALPADIAFDSTRQLLTRWRDNNQIILENDDV
jgi:ADP-ribose pyrophosphatase YjhB (NUDIX family)